MIDGVYCVFGLFGCFVFTMVGIKVVSLMLRVFDKDYEDDDWSAWQ